MEMDGMVGVPLGLLVARWVEFYRPWVESEMRFIAFSTDGRDVLIPALHGRVDFLEEKSERFGRAP